MNDLVIGLAGLLCFGLPVLAMFSLFAATSDPTPLDDEEWPHDGQQNEIP